MLPPLTVQRLPLRLLQGAALLLTLGCGHTLAGQKSPKTVAVKPVPALMLTPLAGQSVPLMPVSYLLAADSVPGLPTDHAAQLRWADSLIGEQLVMRGPEVTWVLPAALRQIARRAPGTVGDPDRMGQSLLRNPSLKLTPDPILTNLRPLMGMANARFVMVPASVLFARTAGGVDATVMLVMLDVRTGAIIWRSEPTASGATASAALQAVFPRILP